MWFLVCFHYHTDTSSLNEYRGSGIPSIPANVLSTSELNIGTADVDYVGSDLKNIKKWNSYPGLAMPDTVYLDDSCPHPCPRGKYSKAGDGYW